MTHSVPTRRVLTYMRVSTQEQSTRGTSLDGQAEELDRHCAAVLPQMERGNFVEVESGSEKGEERRVEVARLLASVRAGDVVVVTKIDRFTRNLLFAVSQVKKIIAKGARFVSLAEGEFDGSAEGEFRLAVLSGAAQLEHSRIVERTQSNRKRLRRMGFFVEGKAPFGYRLARGENARDKRRTLEMVESEATAVRKTFELCLEGWSTDRISAHLKQTFTGANFSDSWVLWALRNRIYTVQVALSSVRPRKHRGSAPLPAEWVDAHAPIVSLSTFEQAQAALASRRSHGAKPGEDSRTATWLLRRMLHCDVCGALIGGVARPTRAHKGPGYYVCRGRSRPRERERCSAAYANQDRTDAAMEAALIARLTALPALLADVAKPQRAAPDFDRRRKDIAARKMRLIQAVESGVLTIEDVRQRARDLEVEVSTLECEAAAIEKERGDTAETRRESARFVETASAQWGALAPAERRIVIGALAEKLTIKADGTLSVSWREPSALGPAVVSASKALGAQFAHPSRRVA